MLDVTNLLNKRKWSAIRLNYSVSLISFPRVQFLIINFQILTIVNIIIHIYIFVFHLFIYFQMSCVEEGSTHIGVALFFSNKG